MVSVPRFYLIALSIAAAVPAAGCGGATSASSTTNTTSVYPGAYKTASWGSNTTVTFPSACSMSYVTNGVPTVRATYYLAPAANGQTVVTTTPVSKTAMALIAYSSISASLKGATVTVNVCPTAAASTTATSGGAIGFLISGIALFNSYEATGQPALVDNVTYTFTDSNSVSQSASFIDSCSSHAAGMGSTSTWHYHGVPSCVTSLVDTSTGPSHLIGFALDGYPIYGGRDINGNVIAQSQLDACNGITSATPELSSATYHYVLPIGVTGSTSSISCYHGTVDATVAAMAKKLACRMPGMTVAGMAAPGMPMSGMAMPDVKAVREATAAGTKPQPKSALRAEGRQPYTM